MLVLEPCCPRNLANLPALAGTRACVSTSVSGLTAGPSPNSVPTVPVVVLLHLSLQQVISCQVSWVAGRLADVGTEKKKPVCSR